MFSFLRKNLVAELVILVVESEYNEQFSMSSHVIVSAPTKINLNELKKRLRGVTGVPPERIMLIFCGQILTNEKEYVPLEAFEPLEVVDEDHLSFMPRLSMRIIDDPVVHVPEEEEDAERRRPVIDDGADTGQAKLKHRHKHRSKGDFDIEKELGGDVNCVAFIPVLRKAGYDNEGSFANVSLDILHGPGLWIPLAAARRIHSVCLQVRKRLAQKDKDEGKHHYRHVEAPAPESEGGTDQQHPQEDGVTSEGAEPHATKNKADARREYEAELIRQKKAAREEAALLKSGKARKKTDALKQHSEELQRKIDSIRIRVAREAEESSGDFDEITGILYNSYSKLKATNQKMNTHLLEDGQDQSKLKAESRPSNAGAASVVHARPSTTDSSSHQVNSSTAVVGAGGGSPTRALRALRTSASSASFAFPSSPSTHSAGCLVVGNSQLADNGLCGYCCANHKQAVLNNREKYIARRRLTISLELQVLLDRLRSSQSGYVTSTTLSAIAKHHLQQYRGMPRRSADLSLAAACVEVSRLDLAEQRSTVLWVQRQEVEVENLLSVVPVRWYSPNKFIAHFVDLLEELDRERMEEEPA